MDSFWGINSIFFKSREITYRNLGKNGRFGNQLWQIFSTIGISQKLNLEVKFGAWEYEKYFSFPEKFWERPKFQSLNSTIFAKHLGSQATYLQDLNLIPADIEGIKQYLKPSYEIAEVLETYSDLYKITNRQAIHIRRTDYLLNDNYHTVPGIKWYKDEINDESLIFTDDIAWCKKNFGNVEIVNQNEIISWFLMARCKSFVISASSYSWWAAYISQSRNVIYPKPWSQVSLKKWNTQLFLPNYFTPKVL